VAVTNDGSPAVNNEFKNEVFSSYSLNPVMACGIAVRSPDWSEPCSTQPTAGLSACSSAIAVSRLGGRTRSKAAPVGPDGPFDADQRSLLAPADYWGMKPPPEQPRPGKGAPATRPTRSEEIRQVIEEYANDLRDRLFPC